MIKRVFKIVFAVVQVTIIIWFLIVSFIDLSLGCPPPPFAHRCLMKQAGVLPPFNNLNNN